MGKRISQSKIAQELGVSQSLVSIVLNGRKEGIAENTYKRIWDFALEHGYSPKGMKLPPNSQETPPVKTVGYILRAPLRLANKSNFFSHVTQGLHDYLREQKVNMVFLGSEMDFKPKELHKISWQREQLHGIVIMGQVAPSFLSALRELGKPLVYISARSPGICHSVNANEYQSAEQLVNHFYELGHRHFAYFGGMRSHSRYEERLTALSMALKRHDLSLPEAAIFSDDEAERREGYMMAEKLLNAPLDPFPTAWICVNGLTARGALSRLLTAGLRLGEDVSVGAFDNTRVCSEELPGITSASAIPEDLGREAGRIVLDPSLHGGDSLLDVVLPSRFHPRESSGPVPEKRSRSSESLSVS
jgi:LacI family transcriptional regulator